MIPAILMRLFSVGCILMTTPVFAGESSTSYWYGGELHPLVITRDGVSYRLIGKGVVEEAAAAPTRSYAHADHLGSTRVITDEQGSIAQSLGYDGDFGSTRIAGESTAATDDSVASFYRFQGQEQEVFPLARLGITDPSLAAWMDQIEFYHFPWRDYAAGLAAFTETDPISAQNSPYAAFGANPVNNTDETGGMWSDNDQMNFPWPAHRNISPHIQTQLDTLQQVPRARLNFRNFDLLQALLRSVTEEARSPYNPPFGGLRSDHASQEDWLKALRELGELRQERLKWLNTYEALISGMWNPRRAYIYGDADDDLSPEDEEMEFWQTNFPVTGNDDEKKAEHEVKEQHDEKSHEPG